MARTEFITSTITNHTYVVTLWNKSTKTTEDVNYSTKVKTDSESICKAWNKWNKVDYLKAIDATWKGYSERKFRLELTKFIDIAEPIDTRKNGDYISRNIVTTVYDVTVWNKIMKTTEVVKFSTKIKGNSEDICKAWNKSNKVDYLKAIDAEKSSDIEQMYCISIDDMIFYGEEIDTTKNGEKI